MKIISETTKGKPGNAKHGKTLKAMLLAGVAGILASLVLANGALAHQENNKPDDEMADGMMKDDAMKDDAMKDDGMKDDGMKDDGMKDDGMMSEEKMIPTGKMSASADGVAIWQFPDRRELDPELFGTPDAPINVDLLPLDNRLTNGDGTAYTTIKNPAMFSNNIEMTTGTFSIDVKDLTAKDDPDSLDEVDMDASFVSPGGQTIRVTMNRVIPVGPDHPFFGGVGTNVLMHGATGIGTPLVAEEFSYITAWGLGDIYVDGEKVDSNRVVHVMVSERTRDADFRIGFGVAMPDQLEIHLALPPVKGSPDGPVSSPVPTGVTLPNGNEQPFVHVNFYGNLSLEGNRFYNASM